MTEKKKGRRFDAKYPWKHRDRCRCSHESVDELTDGALDDARSKDLTHCESGDSIVIVQTDEDGTRHVLACHIEKEFEIKPEDQA